MRDDWFQKLFGFPEFEPFNASHLDSAVPVPCPVRENLSVTSTRNTTRLVSSANGNSFAVGEFTTPSLAELRARSKPAPAETCCYSVEVPRLKFVNVLGDVQHYLADEGNRHATFQVASQFNCLEFPGPSVLPEAGVTKYVGDRTQGPACSIACGPATVWRNYFCEWTDGDGNSHKGQSESAQINNISAVQDLLDNAEHVYFAVQGGYTQANATQLQRLNARLQQMTEEQIDALRAALCVGMHSNVEVTATNWGDVLTNTPEHTVTQVFGSACAVGYSFNTSDEDWQPLACLVLQASYEATLLIAAEMAAQHGWKEGTGKVYLTALGGGVFGNPMPWITQAMDRACAKMREHPLEVYVVTYAGEVDAGLQQLEAKYNGT